jgi:type IV pilus assembly protein PilO
MDKLKQWVLLTVVGCLAVLAAGWFLLISPKKAEATDLVAQTAAQEAANDGLRTQLQVLKAQAKDLPKKQADLARVATKIPDNPAMPSLIRALTAAATSAGVELISVTPGVPVAVEAPVGAAPVAPAAAQAVPAPAAAAPAGPVVPGTAPAAPGTTPAGAPAGALATIPLSINVIGGYFEVSQFLADLEGLPRALRVTNLTLAPGTSPTAVVTAGAATAPAVPDGRTLTTTITGSVFLAANRPPAAAVVAPVG